MFTRKAVFSGFVCLYAVFFGSLAYAGGPNDITPNSVPVRWDPPQFGYIIDNGPLGGNTRDQAANLVRSAFKAWQDVPSSTMSFNDLGFLNVDINLNNYNAYISAKRPEGNVIIFDSDGSITNDLLGAGSTDVLGFANAIPATMTSTTFDFAFAVLNGPNSTDPDFLGTMIHEFGHMIGLDHTQAGLKQAMSGVTADNVNIPIMFPFRFPFAPNSPRPDDIAWVSWLYPTSDFATTTGTITGQIISPDGTTPLPGANVQAVEVTVAGDGSITEDSKEFVSVVSDFLVKGDGSYVIPGLAPGNYVVFIEPMFNEFTGGSSVGPFDNPFANFFKDYWNGAAESNSDNPNDKVVISVAAGQTVPQINIVANEITNRLDLLFDDSSMRYKFPDGFTFPFFGQTYTEVFVNSDGNLTFGAGDNTSDPRDPARFLNGRPRIAPLFTDLDLSNSGQVTATSGTGEFTFTWDHVPEFADTGTPPPNTFSVTLFSNGNIRFRYDQLAVTPDPDANFPAGLQAVVGISPGGGVTGQTVDLSTSPANNIASKPIYEVFPGTSLDLVGKEINFVAANTQLLFPFYSGNALTFSGYAFTNFSSEDATLQLEARGSDGSLLNFPDNPHSETVPSETQVAKLGSEYFNIPISTTQSGWIRVTSNTPGVASFFEFGDGLTGPITKMDGSVAVTAQSKTLFFTRIYDGPAVFPTFAGNQDATTRISLANPNSSPITVRFTFFAPTGQPVGSGPDRTIPANGFLLERVSTLIGVQTPLNDGYLRVDVTQGNGAIGFELIETNQSLMGLNASYGNAGNVAFSAQLASGSDTGIGVFTSFKLVNTSSSTRVVTITPYKGDGSVLSTPLANVTLLPNQTFQRDAGETFAGSPAGSVLGSLVVQADGPGVIGDVVFGDPQVANYAAALPLQTVLFRKAVFSQVANGQLSADPSMDCFTGLALFNPNSSGAQVTVKVFDKTGSQVGSTLNLTLGPNNRISDLVENLIAGTSNLIQGYITVDSTQPLVAQELFGNASLSFLSAVPAQVVQ